MYLQHLYPTPVSVSGKEDIRYRFGAEEILYTSVSLPSGTAERLKALWNRFCCTASVLTVREVQDSGVPCAFWLGAQPEQFPVLAAADTYALTADETHIAVTARNEKGLLEGFMTLLQLICPQNLEVGQEAFSVSGTEIHDAPAIGFRGVHLCIFPESRLITLKKAIHLAGFLKMTHVVLEFWGVYPYEAMPELCWRQKSFTRAEIRELVDLIHSYGMEVIPMINHFGHASSSRVGMGRHTVLNANPRRAKLYEPDGWTWCLSNPDTFQLLHDMREELYTLCGEGSYFHLGFDEAYSFATCEQCRKRVPYELLAEYINRLTEDVAAHGRRPILWHDEFLNGNDFWGKIHSPVVANGQNHNTYPALDLLDRRVILADWQYDYRNGENVTTQYFMDKGFDVLLSPWDNPENIRSLAANTKSLGAMGILLTTWDHLPAYLHRFPAAAEMVWRSASKDETLCGDILTEAAALLRTLCDTDGDFSSSGWNDFEVLQ